METIVLKKSQGAKSNSKIKFKEGTLRRQLKMKRGDKFTKASLGKLKGIEIGAKFTFRGNNFKMTKLMKERVNLGLTLMKFK
jgi:hypothetical protein